MLAFTRSRFLSVIVCGILVCFFQAGCGGKTGPRFYKITGTISYKGKPVSGASISFIPQDKSARPARGTTDEKGQYRLTTLDPGDGVVAGKHSVAIALRAPYDGPKPAHVGGAYDEELQDLGKPLIPEKYFSPLTSQLMAEVTDGGKLVVDFELKD